MIDASHLKALLQFIPRSPFVRIHGRTYCDVRAQEAIGRGFRLDDGRDGIVASLTNDNDNLSLSGLITG